MSVKRERVVETLYEEDGTIVFRRSNGTIIWEGNPPEAGSGSGAKKLTPFANYRYQPTYTPPPSAGQARTDTSDVSTTTKIWLNRMDNNGRDIKFLYLQLKAGDKIYVQDMDNSDSRAFFTLLQDSSDNGAYVEFPVKCDSFSGTPLSGNSILVGAYM